ncbi:MAG: hypothetical protein MMC23_008420 [Stictis urceolatum]|nr:hypothetical protein [Stictis urceolata]
MAIMNQKLDAIQTQTNHLILAFQSQRPILLYALCGTRPPQNRFSSRSLVKQLIVQFLSFQLSIAFSDSSLFNEHRFAAASTFSEIWGIFRSLAEQVKSLFVLIDRIEECKKRGVCNLTDQVLQSLERLAEMGGRIGVVVTSQMEPTLELEGNVKSVFIDTRRRVGDWEG